MPALLNKPFPTYWRRQAWLLAILTWAFVLPRLSQIGTNIVTNTYQEGAARFLRGENPYVPSLVADRFEYSPLFALLYSPFTHLSPAVQAVTWAFLNCLLFWLGISAWFSLRKRSFWLIAAFVACSMEMNISVLYQQVNALLAGLVLLGLAYYQAGHRVRAGFVLALATNLKTLPGIFAIPLLFAGGVSYPAAFVLSSLLFLLAPSVLVGFSANWQLHLNWFGRLLTALRVTLPGQNDIYTSLKRLGYPAIGFLTRWTVLLASLTLLFLAAFRRRVSWYPWIAVAATGLLLISPRSESPSFVLLAPVYIFLTAALLDEQADPVGRWLGGLGILTSFFFITLTFTDLWSKHWWDPRLLWYATKSLGTLPLWLIAVTLLIRDMRRSGSYTLTPWSSSS